MFQCVRKVGSTWTAFKDGNKGARFEYFLGATPKVFTSFIIVVSSNGKNNNWIIIIAKIIMMIIKVLF